MPPHIEVGKNKLATEADGHYYWLDLIRFLAAFVVMACHSRGSFFVDYSSLPDNEQNIFVFAFFFLTRLGNEAVMIFFVLSGLLVGGRGLKRIASGQFKPTSYAIDRAVRILLPLIGALLLYIPIVYFNGGAINIITYIGCLFSLQGILTGIPFSVLWSLSYEVWFYIMLCGFGIVFSARININSWKYLIGVILVVTSMLVFVKLSVYYLFVWILGALAYYRLPRTNNLAMWFFGVMTAIICVLLQLGSGSMYLPSEMSSGIIFRSVLSIFFALCFSIFIQQVIQKPPKTYFLKKINVLGTKLAAFSYTLYLTHVPVIRLLEGLGVPKSPSVNFTSICLYCLWIGFEMLVAYGVYWVFERNTQTVKKYIKAKLLRNH